MVACLLLLFAGIFLVSGRAAEETKINHLRQILITDSLEAAPQLAPVENGGFVVVTPSLAKFDRAELTKKLAAAENQVIGERLLAAIAQVVEQYAREHDFPAAIAVVPPQNIAGGIVRVAVLLGKIRNIRVEGNQWFSESLLREKLRMERGRPVQLSELEPALHWTNNSPFRRVRIHLEPVPNTGEVDVLIGVKDRAPVRLTASYDNTGNEVLGENRYAVGVSYSNIWGKDHHGSYQFITTDNQANLRGHGVEYRVPLPSRHSLMFGGSYLMVNPTFMDGLFTQEGRSKNADLKYVLPYTKGRWQGEASAGVLFKQTNNNLEFGGTQITAGASDLLAATIGTTMLRDDSRGRWIGVVSLTASPGEFNYRSTPTIYNDTRIGANPRFAYGQFTLQRQTRLTDNTTSTVRLMLQLASTNLLSSEQFSAGGLSTVRGYKERVISGDGGYSATHEVQVRTPSIKLGRKLPALDTASVFFCDYGRTLVKHPLVRENKSSYLASVGAGLRFSAGNYFSLSFDLARQLEEVELPGEPHHRGHIRVTVSY